MFEARESLNPIMIMVGKPFTFCFINNIREPDRLVNNQEIIIFVENFQGRHGGQYRI